MDLTPIHKLTKDGSSTLYAPRFEEHYHSTHGAVQESLHVFLEMGFKAIPHSKEPLRIFEVGFGTGLNALLTALFSNGKEIHYTSIEAYPLHWESVKQLNYATLLGQHSQPLLEKLHESPWEKDVEILPNFVLNKTKKLLQDYDPGNRFDLVYFDAFAPDTQPELWEPGIFQKIYSWCEPEAILVTYSAKGAVRRSLKSVGFEVEKVPGPPGKREMLRGIKKK